MSEKVTRPDQSSSRPCTQAGKGLPRENHQSEGETMGKTLKSSQPQLKISQF